MDGMGGTPSSSMQLNASGVDFSNRTQAFDFLLELLDDTVLQPIGTATAKKFWYGVGSVVGIAALCNITHKAILRARLRASRVNHARPSQPVHPLATFLATVTAVTRETSYLQFTPTRYSFWIKIPPLGTLYLIVLYFAFLLGLEFYHNDVPGAQHYAGLSIRAAWLALAQLPLIVLLAGKNNIVSLLSGVSYERLHVYHRWIARGMLLMVTLHFGFGSYGWNQFGLMSLEWATDTCPRTGMSAYALLLFINFLTLAPFRNWSYDLVVVIHIISFCGFIVALAYHLIGQTSPRTVYYTTVFLYTAVALYLVERLVRTSRYVYNNIHPGYATLEALGGGATRLRVRTRQIKRWSPGTHVLLSIPRYGILQSHPATILSTPTSHDGDMVFILRAYGGFTKRIFTATQNESVHGRHDPGKVGTKEAVLPSSNTHLTLIDGPYGSYADFACFDTLFLIAGSSGITFTISHLLNIAERARASSEEQNLPLRVVHFLWIIKERSWLSWIAEELQFVTDSLHRSRVSLSIRIFVTCDPSMLTSPGQVNLDAKGCQCEPGCSCCEEDPDAITPASWGTDTSAKQEMKGFRNRTSGAGRNIDTLLPRVQLKIGRPNFDAIFWDALCLAEGESAVAVCGSLSLSTSVRNTIVAISDERAVHKGTGAQGIYLHVENFH